MLKHRAILSFAFVFIIFAGITIFRYLPKHVSPAVTHHIEEASKSTSTPQIAPQETPDKEIQLVVGRGDTLNILLSQVGLNRESIQLIIQALRRSFDPRDLKIGQTIFVKVRQENDQVHLRELSFKPSLEEDLKLTTAPSGQYETVLTKIPLQKITRYVTGQINSSFYHAATQQGIPANLVRDAIKALSYDVDWQREPKSGDKFQIVYEVFENEQGEVIKSGALKYISFAPKGKLRELYHFDQGPRGVFYNAKGESFAKALLRTPLNATKIRISSKFRTGKNKRKHPILGYSRDHKGVDFAAARGTEVYSAGEGVVVMAQWHGGYGNFIKVRHAGGYETAYGHLSRIRVKKGQRVGQGQVIGNVGSTGLSSGNHLHHEVIYHGKHIDPQGVMHTPPNQKLSGKELEAFNALRRQIDHYLATQQGPMLQEAAAVADDDVTANNTIFGGFQTSSWVAIPTQGIGENLEVVKPQGFLGLVRG